MEKLPLGIYVHIPFCQRKCLYCDFNSHDDKNELKTRYTEALIREIGAFCADEYYADSIFFGGGTPTALPLENLESIFTALSNKFSITKNAEISCETNPGVLKDHGRLKNIGFNRLSMGLQSASDDELKTLGRIHTFSEFLKSYENAARYFNNMNIDTMFSLPGQTLESWSETLQKVKSLNPKHISCYSLIIEQGTPFAKMNLDLPDEETDRQMYHTAKEILSEYTRYEISNFAKPGFECRHNLKYWTRMPYIGFGCGAHSQIEHKRFSNVYKIEYYAQNPFSKETETLSPNDEISEYMFLGLRLKEGVNKQKFKTLFGQNIDTLYKDVIQKHVYAGTLISDNKHIALTDRGIDVSNSVMSDFLL